MASEKEEIFSSNESEMAPDKLDLSHLPLDQPNQNQPRPWRYFGIGAGIILLIVTLGGVIVTYLAQPAFDLAQWGSTLIFSPTAGPAVKETTVQFIPVNELTPTLSAQAETAVPASPTSTRVVQETPIQSEPARELTLTISAQADSSAPASPTSTRMVQETPIQPEPVREPTSTIIPQANATAPAPSTPTLMDFVLSDARHFQGDSHAPVTMVEFSDFKCPYCGRFSTETLPQLRQVYIDTGRVRFVYKHFSILGPESDAAAAATECAAEQGWFWEYHNQVFADQAATRSILNLEQLTSLAEKTGLSPTAFTGCLISGRYIDQVRWESEAVGAIGMRTTPSFLINGVFVVGAQPFEVFQQVIEEQLQASNQESK